MEPLNVAILWHQHQPNYKQPDQNIFILPWVRFHALKDYYDLVAILDDFPQIHQNFNLVPSLVMQLEDYIHDRCRDKVEILSRKKAKELNQEEKIELLKYFFQLNPATMVEIYPGYLSLWHKRGEQFDENNSIHALNRFSDHDYLDLQVWYNLSWVGEQHKKEALFIDLIAKDHHFSETDKQNLFTAQKEILKKILPKHAELKKRGQIEISTTPLYHPILPLLCDTDIARVSQPEIKLPKRRFRYPQDANEQIAKAIAFHRDHFGEKPVGMWPSEGSISEEVVQLFAGNQIKWIATDEEILFHSWKQMNIHTNMKRENLYAPWNFKTLSGDVSIFFRDHTLSDLIGFVYQTWDAEKAAQDFVARLQSIRKNIADNFGEPHLKNAIVSIILDGENCWEYYPNNGKDFLQALYRKLTDTSEIKTVTFAEFLHRKIEQPSLTKIFPGSWINHNYNIWIGHKEDNTAWDYVTEARELLDQAEKEKTIPEEKLQQAKEEIFIAEGSDWCWWYGEDHETENAPEFDQIFRAHVIRVYELLGKEVPAKLFDPIRKQTHKKLVTTKPTGFITPVIDGLETNYFEWMAAGLFDANRQGAAMHQTAQTISTIHYGFDLENFYLKVAFHDNATMEALRKYELEINILAPQTIGLFVAINQLLQKDFTDEITIRKNGKKAKMKNGVEAAFRHFFEIKIPFKLLACSTGDLIKLQISLWQQGQKQETWPQNGVLKFEVPGPDFEQIEWKV